jgi:glycosyltransferase involved in cell wall biosynthesis
MPTCAVVSFRLGLTDGVSIVAESWGRALGAFGFEVVTVAGEGVAERLVPGLAIDAPQPADVGPLVAAVGEALADADLVVVENLCTIPLNLPAARAVAEVLSGRPAILHHHDPPWQRERFAHVTELPPDDRAWRHVTINELTRHQFAERGLHATTIYNGFDVGDRPGDREAARARIGVSADEVLVAHPVRAIARKGIAAAVRLCEELRATYWLLGAPEEGYGPELDDILGAARCRVVHQAMAHGPDLYAAADLVVFPSTWEGFGNPPIEASLALRPTAIGPYPVGAEVRALGFEWFDVSDTPAIEAFLAHPDPTLLERNRALAHRHFSLEAMAVGLGALLDEAGWRP